MKEKVEIIWRINKNPFILRTEKIFKKPNSSFQVWSVTEKCKFGRKQKIEVSNACNAMVGVGAACLTDKRSRRRWQLTRWVRRFDLQTVFSTSIKPRYSTSLFEIKLSRIAALNNARDKPQIERSVSWNRQAMKFIWRKLKPRGKWNLR